MKTSNKILLSGFLLVFVATLIFLFYIKSNIKGIKGDGQIIIETRETPSFSGIKIKNRIKVKFTQDSLQKIIVKTDNNLMNLIKTEVKNDTLNIYAAEKYSVMDTIIVEVTSDKIKFIDLSQSSEFKGLNKISGDTITFNINSWSRLNADIDFTYLNCKAASMSIVNLSGNVETLKLINNSSSKFLANNLLVKNCFVNSKMHSRSEINVSKELTVEAKGNSKIKYSGNPALKGVGIKSGASLIKFKE
ncbi:MAG: hypothetical protein DRJ01_16130 [Bacteroidetes bacterium]|nr:MAG: hypothetical protein DRJ01_16130 [Bacteroidota bacterium]